MSWPKRTIGPNGKVYVGRDLEAVRYFVYRLLDENGTPLYIGLSCNVPSRIKAHVREAQRGHFLKAKWVPLVRDLTMVGPFKWLNAVERERSEIEQHQPFGNRQYTKRFGWQPRHEPHYPFAASP